MGISRRAVVIGSGVLGATAGLGGWALLADARLVPGRGVVDRVLGRCDITATPPTQASPGRVFRSSFYSRKRRRSVNYMLAYPPKVAPGAKLPVCLCLHGMGEDERAAFDGLGYHMLLAAAVAAKVPPFVLASVAGGNGYWHPHPDDDPLGMLLSEFPSVLIQHGLPVNRLGLLGWSMGGYGAIVAATEAPATFPVVVANAPAFWSSYEESQSVNPGAFSSAQEWRTWGICPPGCRACAASPSASSAASPIRSSRPSPTCAISCRTRRRCASPKAATTGSCGARSRRSSCA